MARGSLNVRFPGVTTREEAKAAARRHMHAKNKLLKYFERLIDEGAVVEESATGFTISIELHKIPADF